VIMFFLFSTIQIGGNVEIKYPQTKTVNVVDTLFGVKIPDPYRWLENIDSREVRDWINKQNDLTMRILRSLPERKNLIKELKKLFDVESISLPIRKKDFYFYYKRENLQNHSILYMEKKELDFKRSQVILDPNKFSKDGTVALDWAYISEDGRYIAYGKSKGGTENSTLYVLDVETGKNLKEKISNTKWVSFAWLPDNSGFYYSINMVKKGFKPFIYFHKLGDDYNNDKYIFGKGLPEDVLPEISPSSNHRFLFLSVSKGWTKNDLYVKGIEPGDDFIPISIGKDGIFNADVLNDKIIIYTTYGAPRGRILSAPLNSPGEDNWREIIPEKKAVIQGFHIYGGRILIRLKQDTFTRLLIYSNDGIFLREISLPEMGTAYTSGRWNCDTIYISFQSFYYPPTIFSYNLKTGEMKKIWQMKSGINMDDYTEKLVFYLSKDSTKIPMYIIYKKGIKLNGKNPTLLTGYGGFGLGISPHYQKNILPWLERGGVFATPGIRGGNEYGEEWHKAGMLEHKQNVFDDFIAAAEYLIDKKYTSPEKLAISGGSNGGLLMGAMITQRPDLFRAVLCQVPLLDMLRYHKFLVGYIWIPEYGNPAKEEDFKYIYKYSPYQHIKNGVTYPAVLFKTAEGDGRVHPMHAMKMAAYMQMFATKGRPILLYVEPKAGHGVGKPLKKYIEEYADNLSFLMWQLGMKKTGKTR